MSVCTGSAAGGVGEGGGAGAVGGGWGVAIPKAEKMSFLTAPRLALFKEPPDHQPASTTWAKPALW